MKDENKTKEQLISELEEMRKRNSELEKLEVERKQAESSLQYRVKLDNLVTTISTNFINLTTGEIDDGINNALQVIGEFVGVDRSYVFQFHDNGIKMDNTHEWCAERIEPQIDNLKNLPVSIFPWWMEKLNQFLDISIPRVVDLPSEANAEREILQLQDIQSLVVVPMICSGNLTGFLGFDSVRSEKVWDEDVVALLRIVGEIFANALERKRGEEMLRTSEEKHRAVVENAGEGIVVAQDGMLKFLNPQMLEIMGYSKEELTSRPFVAFIHPDHKEMVLELHIKRLKGEKLPHIYPFKIIDKNGNIKWLEINTVLITWEDRPATLNFLNDITERKRAENALKQIEWLLNTKSVPQKYYEQPYGNLVELNTSRLLVASLGEDVLIDIVRDYLDLLGTSTAVYESNGDYALGILASGWCRLLNQSSRNLCKTDDNRKALISGKWYCHESCWNEASKVSIETGQPIDIECQGGIHIYSVPILAGEEIIGAINFGYGDPPKTPQKLGEISERFGISMNELLEATNLYESRPPFIIDIAKNRLQASARLIGEITERKRMENQIKASLREKELLLREIHHRVTNNLTIISSLLNMKSRRTDNQEVVDTLQEARAKIYTVALIHEQLYQSEKFGQINMGEHSRQLVADLFQIYNVLEKRITPLIEHSDFTLSLTHAIPCALVLNELISNAFKHAFHGREEGKIEISAHKVDDTVRIKVKDDGIGIPQEIDIDSTDSLGFKLIRNIVRMQLKGTIQINQDQGTEVIIEFKIPEEEEEHV